MQSMTISQPRIGYYICDGINFESKIRALLHSKATGKPVEWIFNDKVFKSFNWTVEPELDLEALYDKRARQLRDKYDYLILSYSGGADSHNALMAFVRQGLLIDEILVNTMETASSKFVDLDPNNKSPENTPAEYQLQTVPRLKEIAWQIPKTKITVTDLTDHIFSSFEDAKDASWVLTKKERINPVGTTRYNYLYFNEVRKNFDRNKKIALVMGIEKPKVQIVNGELFMTFLDRVVNTASVADHFWEYTNSSIEFFYWSPDCVPLMIKQGHVIKRWLEANPALQVDWLKENITPEKARRYQEKLLKGLLYSTWNQDWFQTEKAVRDWDSEFDNWFIDGYKDTKAFQIWKEGVDYLRTELDGFHNIQKGEPNGLVFFSKHYNLGPVKNFRK